MLGASLLVSGAVSCATGDLNDCSATYDSGDCSPTGIKSTVGWDYATCDDDCHYIRIYEKIQETSCSGGTPTQEVTGLSCDYQTGCSPGVGEEGCYVTGDTTYKYDAGGTTHFFCYYVQVRRDSDDGLDEEVECYYTRVVVSCFA